jgi:hypothetical protein
MLEPRNGVPVNVRHAPAHGAANRSDRLRLARKDESWWPELPVLFRIDDEVRLGCLQWTPTAPVVASVLVAAAAVASDPFHVLSGAFAC